MWKTILIALAVIAAFYIAWMGGQAAYTNTLENQAISPGDISISQVSNSSVDWVTIHNNLGREVDLHGFVFTDGDNIFTFPAGSTVSRDGNLRIAASKDEGDIREPVDLYWGDWGLSEDGELVMLINDAGDGPGFRLRTAVGRGRIARTNPNWNRTVNGLRQESANADAASLLPCRTCGSDRRIGTGFFNLGPFGRWITHGDLHVPDQPGSGA